jgi:hypothetical protein
VVARPRRRRTEAAVERVDVGALLQGRDGPFPQPLDSCVESFLPEVDLDNLLEHFMIGGAKPRLRISEDELGTRGGS